MNRTIETILGYLNFSSGVRDPSFFGAMNDLFRYMKNEPAEDGGGGKSSTGNCTAYRCGQRLQKELAELQSRSGAFSDSRQASGVLEICFGHVLPQWTRFHLDQLFHQDEEFLFNSFFVARVCEQTIRTEIGGDPEIATASVMRALNDYLGHRPVATLEGRRMEPYLHEYVGPVPVYVRDVGAAVGAYEEIVNGAMEILKTCDEEVMRAAQLDLSRLQELSIDPRSLDFDHPVNRRPNHHFGQWDEQTVDGDGFYSRFIIHKITVDSMLLRVEEEQAQIPRSELMFEAGAVLACTMLMGSGISGRGPGAWDSTMTLGGLVPIIAAYRDRFYQSLLEKMPQHHRERLLAEAKLRHQPFGAARQHINHQLSVHRDRQLVTSRVAAMYARMGYEEAALQQADVVQVASTRINTQLDCLISSASVALRNGKLEVAVGLLPRLFEMIKRGIECGALPDPWTILGFDGNYSLFPAHENTVRDHRVDDLVELMNQVFQLCAQLWADSAAADQKEIAQTVQVQFREISDWWRKYAAHEVASMDSPDPEDVYEASRIVAEALNLWHRGGAATGDLEFWSQHAQLFESPAAYALVISALLERNDFKTSRALLIHWLNQSDQMELDSGDHAFHELLWQWLAKQKDLATSDNPAVASETWARIGKLYDYLEANADEYWEVPDFHPEALDVPDLDEMPWDEGDEEENPFASGEEEEEFEEDAERGILGAAYEGVVYNDQTDDGIEGSIHDGGGIDDADLEAEVMRVNERLDFHISLAGYWRIGAMFSLPTSLNSSLQEPGDEIHPIIIQRREIYAGWLEQALANRSKLLELLEQVHGFAIAASGVDTESMQQYDRQRGLKESLVQQIMATNVEVENAIRMLAAAIVAIGVIIHRKPIDDIDPRLKQWQPVISVYAAAMLRNSRRIVDLFPALNESLKQQSLLYIPLSRGGHPADIVRFRSTQSAIRELLATLPRLGLLLETCELTETAMAMERNTPSDQGAVTEFDEIFRVAYCAMAESLILASQATRDSGKRKRADRGNDEPGSRNGSRGQRLFHSLQELTQSMLGLWLEHSRTLRLSVLEKVQDRASWQQLVGFIQTYGDDLLTQDFLHLSNVRAILHQGVDQWLYRLQGSENADSIKLLRDIGNGITFRQAVNFLTLVLESVIENYSRYRDYNATTTQSDQGGLLYILLDFLRLERRYDRIGWRLKPVIWAHQMLVHNDENHVARQWRRTLNERVGSETDRYIAMLQKLREKYSVQLASIGQHLEGRFVQPMLIDRLVTLVSKAMKTPGTGDSQTAFEMLQVECQSFMENSPGVGVDLPDWLAAMSEEVENQQTLLRMPDHSVAEIALVPVMPVEMDRLIEQIEMLPRHSFNRGDESESTED